MLAVAMAVPVGVVVAGRQIAAAPASGAVTVQAELLEPALAAEMAVVVDGAVPTRARWTTAGGVVRTGLVWADAGQPRGELVAVEVDTAGGVLNGHPRTEDPLLTGLLAGTATLLCCWVVLAVVAVAWRARLAARDAVCWATDWARFEPVWSGRTG
jgi:hypothetical protein